MDRELLDCELNDEINAVKQSLERLHLRFMKRRQPRADVRKVFAPPTQVIDSAILWTAHRDGPFGDRTAHPCRWFIML